MQTGHPRNASLRLEKLLAAQPDQAQLAFNLITAQCMTGGISASDIDATTLAMQTTFNPGSLLVDWFERTLPLAMQGTCPGLTAGDLLVWLDAGLGNPHLAGASCQQDLIYLRGRIALASHRPEAALTEFSHALDLEVRPDMALGAAAALGSNGYPKQGLNLLDHYQQVQAHALPPTFGMPVIHAWILSRQHYWPHEFAALRHQLILDAQNPGKQNAQQRSLQGTQG